MSYEGNFLYKVNQDFTYTVTAIGEKAFEDCTWLTAINIPNSVTDIGTQAFMDCTSLTQVNIGGGVMSIGNYAFEGCEKLTVYCEASVAPDTWSVNWNYDNRPVVWGYKGEPI